MIDVIDEERRTAATSQFIQQFVAPDRTADSVRHLRPTAADDPARGEDENSAFGALLFGKRLEHGGFADARWAGDMYDA